MMNSLLNNDESFIQNDETNANTQVVALAQFRNDNFASFIANATAAEPSLRHCFVRPFPLLGSSCLVLNHRFCSK